MLKTPEQRVFPCSLWWKTVVRQVVPLQSREVHGGADLHLQPVEGTPCRSRWMPKGSCEPGGSKHWSRLLLGPVDLWREDPTLEQVCWQGLWPHGGTISGAACSWRTAPHGKEPCWGSLWRAAAHGKDLCWRSLSRTVSSERNLHAGAGAECKESWGTRSGRDNVWWTDHNPHSLSPCAARGEEVGEIGVKLSPGRREGWGEGVLRSGFISHYPTLIWLLMS